MDANEFRNRYRADGRAFSRFKNLLTPEFGRWQRDFAVAIN
jgi:hypothetical protein